MWVNFGLAAKYETSLHDKTRESLLEEFKANWWIPILWFFHTIWFVYYMMTH